MIFDEISDVLNTIPVNKIRRLTGMKRGRIYSLRCGCTFNLDYGLVAALEKLGYEVRLEKTKRAGGED